MISEEVAKELHDRATRGLALSAAERAALDAWYAQQDAEESATLAGSQLPQNLAMLRSQVDKAMSELLVVVHSIQAQAAENERIRREVAELQGQLAAKMATQKA
jgi:hypothetical protein